MAQNQTTYEVPLVVTVDDAALQRAKQRLQELEQANKALAREFLDGSRDGDKYSDALKKNEKEARQLKKAIDELTKSKQAEENQANQNTQANNAEAESLDKLTEATTRGQATGRRGGRGTLGSIGTTIRDLPAIPIPGTQFTSEVPARLLQGLDQFNISLTQLGVVAGIAVAGLVILNPLLSAQAERNKDLAQSIRAVAEARQTIDEFLRGGATTEDIQRRREDLLQQETDAISRVNAAQDDYLAAREREFDVIKNQQFGEIPIITDALVEAELSAREALGRTTEQLDEYQTTLDEEEQKLKDIQAELDQLGSDRAQEIGLANTEAETLQRLNEARAQAALITASNEARLTSLTLTIQTYTEQQIDAELRRRDIQVASIESQLDVLGQLETQTEQTREEISRLAGELGVVQRERQILEAERPAAQARDLAIEQAKELEDAEKELAKREEQRVRALYDYNNRLEDLQIKLADKIEDIFIDFGRDTEKFARELARDFRDEIIDAQRSTEDAIRSGDFLALPQIALESERAKEDLLRNAEDERAERKIKLDQQLEDAQRWLDRQERDLQRSYERQLFIINGGLTFMEERVQQFADTVTRIADNMVANLSNYAANYGGGKNPFITQPIGSVAPGSDVPLSARGLNNRRDPARFKLEAASARG